jgi:hypothetical protein
MKQYLIALGKSIFWVCFWCSILALCCIYLHVVVLAAGIIIVFIVLPLELMDAKEGA